MRGGTTTGTGIASDLTEPFGEVVWLLALRLTTNSGLRSERLMCAGFSASVVPLYTRMSGS